jgi:hypothetical protein
MAKFSIRDLLWLMTVVALVVALIYVKQPVAAGRYQLILSSDARVKYFLDTATGKYWIQTPGNGWEPSKTPLDGP